MSITFVLTVSDDRATTYNVNCDQWENDRDYATLAALVETPEFKVFAGLDGGYQFWQIWQGERLVTSGRIFQE